MNARRDVLTLTLILAASGCAGDSGETSTAVAEIRGGSGGHTGRFAARALLGRDSQTQFDTTTGAFDTTTPAPGAIANLRLTVLNDDGSVRLTRAFVYLDPAGAYSFMLAGLARGTQYQIDAIVSGVRPDPAGNVQVSDVIRLRPDIIVGPDRAHIVGPDRPGIVGPDRWRGIVGPDRWRGIVGPDRVRVGQPVQLMVAFREANGDVGALTDCQLAVDGTLVNTQPNLSVTAGGTTMCGFNTTFSTAGVHSVTISAANVKPSDYDLSNNSYTFDIGIVGPDHTHGNGNGNHGNGRGNGG